LDIANIVAPNFILDIANIFAPHLILDIANIANMDMLPPSNIHGSLI